MQDGVVNVLNLFAGDPPLEDIDYVVFSMLCSTVAIASVRFSCSSTSSDLQGSSSLLPQFS